MAFQLTPLRIPSLTTDYSAQTNATQNFGNALGSLIPDMRKNAMEAKKQSVLGDLGKDFASGNFTGAATKLASLGEIGSAAKLLELGQAAKDREADAGLMRGLPGLGSTPIVPGAAGGGASVVPGTSSLIQNESGGNWQAQNSAVGAGGAVGHFGRAQFGQARLQEAANAGAIPQGTTPAQFMNSPELQQRAEAWHFNDIDQAIKQNGYDRLVGQATIGGVPVTVEGLRAVAHLGGKEGMRKFVETGGRYNPQDANGTRLSDYFAKHGGAGGGQPQTRVAQAQPQVQVAETEADVQRLEAAQAAAQPVQVAQAPAQPSAPVADAPAPGAAPAQGFAIPGTDVVVPGSLMDDQRVRALSGALLQARTEKARTAIKGQLDLAVKDAERRYTEGKAPEAVREWQWARQQGLTEAKSPIAYAKEKAEATRQDSAPTTRQIKQADGSEVVVQWNAETKTWEPLAAPKGGEAVRPTGTKLTEGQSKDLIYHSRGLQALEAFEPIAPAYADGVSRLASMVPGGNYAVSEEFQKARQAGRNFLASVLRKDTGAAVTASEEQLYGDIFLPAPGDKPGTLAQKAEARRQAIDAIRNGLGTAEVLALGKRLSTRQPGEDAPARADGDGWQDLGGGIRIREKR